MNLQREIANQFGCSIAAVGPITSFRDELNADSLDLVELVMAIEEAYDIEIPDGTAEHWDCMRDIEEYLSCRGLGS